VYEFAVRDLGFENGALLLLCDPRPASSGVRGWASAILAERSITIQSLIAKWGTAVWLVRSTVELFPVIDRLLPDEYLAAAVPVIGQLRLTAIW
jgi:hypothetical protein